MAEPFQRRARTGVLANLLSRSPSRTVVHDIEGLLAGSQRVCDVPADAVQRLAAGQGVDLERKLLGPRLSLYRRFLGHCLMDSALSESEIADLAHLRKILRLKDDDAGRVHEEVALSVYGQAIDSVLEDHRLDDEEEGFLRRLRSDLDLEAEAAERLLDAGRQRARQRYISRAVSHDVMLRSGETVMEVEGESETSIEDAVQASLEEAALALPNLRWVSLSRIRAEVIDGRASRWHVKVKVVLSERGEG